jgi:hypothetical protein
MDALAEADLQSAKQPAVCYPGIGTVSNRGNHHDVCGRLFILTVDGLFRHADNNALPEDFLKIDRSMSIVAETEQIADHRNLPLKSGAQISDGSGRRFFIARGKICSVRSTHYGRSKSSSGSDKSAVAPIERSVI